MKRWCDRLRPLWRCNAFIRSGENVLRFEEFTVRRAVVCRRWRWHRGEHQA